MGIVFICLHFASLFQGELVYFLIFFSIRRNANKNKKCVIYVILGSSSLITVISDFVSFCTDGTFLLAVFSLPLLSEIFFFCLVKSAPAQLNLINLWVVQVSDHFPSQIWTSPVTLQSIKPNYPRYKDRQIHLASPGSTAFHWCEQPMWGLVQMLSWSGFQNCIHYPNMPLTKNKDYSVQDGWNPQSLEQLSILPLAIWQCINLTWSFNWPWFFAARFL